MSPSIQDVIETLEQVEAELKRGQMPWSEDWSMVPRDGRPVRLRRKDGEPTVLRWSTHYSVFGLGGCWTNGMCTMGEGVDFDAWQPVGPVIPIAGEAYERLVAAAKKVDGDGRVVSAVLRELNDMLTEPVPDVAPLPEPKT